MKRTRMLVVLLKQYYIVLCKLQILVSFGVESFWQLTCFTGLAQSPPPYMAASKRCTFLS